MWKAQIKAILQQILDMMEEGLDAEIILAKIIKSLKEMLE